MQPQAPAVGTRIQQGAIEKSNVRSVVEMTRMIEAHRAPIPRSPAILQQQGDLRRNAIDRLAEPPRHDPKVRPDFGKDQRNVTMR